jgi:hypothetical protein
MATRPMPPIGSLETQGSARLRQYLRSPSPRCLGRRGPRLGRPSYGDTFDRIVRLADHADDQGIGDQLRHPGGLGITCNNLDLNGRRQRPDGVIVAAADTAGSEEEGYGSGTKAVAVYWVRTVGLRDGTLHRRCRSSKGGRPLSSGRACPRFAQRPRLGQMAGRAL